MQKASFLLNFGDIMANKHADVFFQTAEASLKNATRVLGYHYEATYLPYFSGKYHFSSVFYHIDYARKIVGNAIRLATSPLFLIEAVFYEPKTSIPTVGLGFLVEVAAAIVNLLNIVVSIAVLITRSLATLLNGGYANNNSKMLQGKQIGGESEETIKNLADACKTEDYRNKVDNLDTNIFTLTSVMSM